MEIGLEVSEPGPAEDVRRAARTSLARWRAQAARLGVTFVAPSGAEPVLSIGEPEAVVHPNALAAALACEAARVVPARSNGLFVALWEFEALTAGEGALDPPPAVLVRRPGPASRAAG